MAVIHFGRPNTRGTDSVNGAGDKLFAVAKNSAAFRFGPGQSKDGADSFHRFDLPVNANSKPAWSISLNGVQNQFQQQTGTIPFGPVDSAQDNQDNSYVVFALGIPAIAKVSPDGRTISLAMDRRDMGDYLGLTIETVSRTLSQLERDGVIAIPVSRQIRVQKPARLNELAA